MTKKGKGKGQSAKKAPKAINKPKVRPAATTKPIKSGKTPMKSAKGNATKVPKASNPYTSKPAANPYASKPAVNPYASNPPKSTKAVQNPYASTYVNPYTAKSSTPTGINPTGINPKGSNTTPKVINPYASNATQANVIKDQQVQNVSKHELQNSYSSQQTDVPKINAKHPNDFGQSFQTPGPPNLCNANGNGNFGKIANPYGSASTVPGPPTVPNLHHANGTALIANPYGSASTEPVKGSKKKKKKNKESKENKIKIKNEKTVIINNNVTNVVQSSPPLRPVISMGMEHASHRIEPTPVVSLAVRDHYAEPPVEVFVQRHEANVVHVHDSGFHPTPTRVIVDDRCPCTIL